MKYLLVLICVLFSITIVSAQWTQTNGPKGGPISKFLKIGDSKYIYCNTMEVFLSENDCQKWKKIFTLTNPIGKATMIQSISYFNKQLYIGSYFGLYISDENLETFKRSDETYFKETIPCMTSSDTAIYVVSLVRSENIYKVFMKSKSIQQWTSISELANGYKKGYTNDIRLINENIYLLTEKIVGIEGWKGSALQITSNQGKSWSVKKLDISCSIPTILGFKDSTLIVNNNEGGMQISQDLGITWKPVFINGLTNPYIVRNITANNKYIFLVVDGYGIYRSSDQCENWEAVNTSIEDKNIFCLYANNEEAFAGSEYGLFKSNNNANSWIDYNNGIIGSYITDMTADDNQLLVTTVRSGIQFTNDSGDNWQRVSSLDTLKAAYNIAKKGDTILIYLSSNAIIQSIDGGQTWSNVRSPNSKGYITRISLIDKYIFAVSDQGFYRTSDNGFSWDTLYYNSGIINQVSNICFSNGDVFIANWSYGVLTSSDFGNTWNQINNGITDIHLMTLDVKEDMLCAATFKGAVFLSKDRGKNWQQIRKYNANHYISDVLIIENAILIATSGNGNELIGDGVKIYGINKSEWFDIKNGFYDNMSVQCLDRLGNYVFAGTANHSVYKANISDFDYVGVNDEPLISNSIIASPAYPLPSKQIVNTIINWNSEFDVANADMNVYNSLGEKVCGKENISFQQQSPNSGIVTWDAEDNHSGVYFLHITLGNEKKVISFVIE
ncbi:MAG: T9SS type A sorting domain-containing protein [bacterium]